MSGKLKDNVKNKGVDKKSTDYNIYLDRQSEQNGYTDVKVVKQDALTTEVRLPEQTKHK